MLQWLYNPQNPPKHPLPTQTCNSKQNLELRQVWDFWLVYLPESTCNDFALTITLSEAPLLWAVVWVMEAQWLDPGWASESRIASPWPCAAWEAVWDKKHTQLCPVGMMMISEAGPSLWSWKGNYVGNQTEAEETKRHKEQSREGELVANNAGAPEEGPTTCHGWRQS